MDVLQAIVLGIVQGLTEFLPISSSGHLRVVPAFLGWEDPGAAFTAVTQIGTMLAVLVYFRSDLWRITTTWLASLRDPALLFSDIDARVGWYIRWNPADLGRGARVLRSDRVGGAGPLPHRGRAGSLLPS